MSVQSSGKHKFRIAVRPFLNKDIPRPIFEGDYTPHEINRSDSGDSRFGGSAAG
jgi:hypothetical protein